MSLAHLTGIERLETNRRIANTKRRQAALLLLLLAVGVGLSVHDVTATAWYRDRRFRAMDLAALQTARGDRLDDAILLYYIGLRLNGAGRFSEADGILRNAAGLDPLSSRIRGAWAQSLVRTGRISAAFGELREYAGTHPHSAQAHLLLGKFYSSQESYARAVEELTSAVSIQPSLGEAWSCLAAAQSGMGHLSLAEAAAERAASLRPNNAQDRLGLALLLEAEGRGDPALAVFQQTLSIAPNMPVAHLEFARFLLKSGAGSPQNRSLAESQARTALRLSPDSPVGAETLGRVLLAEGEAQQAGPYLLKAASANKVDPLPALELVRAYRELKQPDRQRAWQAEYLRRQKRAQLRSDLISAILRSPSNPAPQRKMAALLAEDGDTDGTLRHDAEAVRSPPDSPPALVAAANDLTTAGHPAEALSLAQRAVDVAPNNPMAREAVGNAMLGLGRLRDAAVSYAQATRGFPDRLKTYQARLDRLQQNRLRRVAPANP